MTELHTKTPKPLHLTCRTVALFFNCHTSTQHHVLVVPHTVGMGGHYWNTVKKKNNQHTCMTTLSDFHTPPCTHSFHVPAQLAIRVAIAAHVSLLLFVGKTQRRETDEALHATVGKAIRSWGSNAGEGSYTGTLDVEGMQLFSFFIWESRWTLKSLSPSRCPLSCGTVQWCTSPPYTSDSTQRLVPAERKLQKGFKTKRWMQNRHSSPLWSELMSKEDVQTPTKNHEVHFFSK